MNISNRTVQSTIKRWKVHFKIANLTKTWLLVFTNRLRKESEKEPRETLVTLEKLQRSIGQVG